MKRGRFFRGFFQNSLQNNRDDIDKTRRNGYTGKSEFFIKLIQGGFRMNKPVLVVLAAGMGSRYGGLKQIDPMGKNGEKILDYSVYDAKRAGFETVVFVIKPEMEQEFEEAVGKHLREHIEVKYAFQSLDKLPEGFSLPEGRTKPWGTGHAVLCAADVIDAPFAVINADDYYGPKGYQLLFDLLSKDGESCAMVAYPLCSTVTENGHVSRGICEVSEDGYLQTVTERTWIESGKDGIGYSEDEGKTFTALDPQVPVSMNFWGFPQSVLKQAKEGFPLFLEKALKENPLKAEYFLPSIVSRMIEKDGAKVHVLKSSDRWYGVTYQEDKETVVKAFEQMTKEGLYPQPLWQE